MKISFVLTKQQKIIWGAFLFILGIALFLSFISYFFSWKADHNIIGNFTNRENITQNWLNIFGANIGDLFVYNGFGVASLIIAFLLILTGIFYFFDFNKTKLSKYWFWGSLVTLWISILFGFFPNINPLFSGVIGFEINDLLQDYLGFIGAVLLMSFLFLVYVIVRLEITPEHFISLIKKTKEEVKSDFKFTPTNSKKNSDKDLDVNEVPLSTQNKEIESPSLNTEFTDTNSSPVLEKKSIVNEKDEEVAMIVEEASEEVIVEKNLSDKLVSDFGEFDPKLELSKYKFPTIELLKEYTTNSGITINQEELEENKNKIVSTLNNYKIGIASIKATVGPTVTLYEIVPEAGIRISKIKNLEDDIALSLSALGD